MVVAIKTIRAEQLLLTERQLRVFPQSTYRTLHHSIKQMSNSWKGVQQCDQKIIAKCLQKLPKNDFTRKIIDFDNFTKIALECGRFGQINCCQRLYKVAHSSINLPLWSHWYQTYAHTINLMQTRAGAYLRFASLLLDQGWV